MKKAMLKKITLLIIMLFSFFLLFDVNPIEHVIAKDLSLSLPWYGDDLETNYLKPVSYDSVYEPFSSIIDHSELIDENKVYIIEKATDLYHLSRLSLGNEGSSYLSLDYMLGNDINYYDAILENIAYRFHPIGIVEPFNGTFNGQGFEITNLYFDTILDEETYDLYYQGMRYYSMFSKVGTQGRVHHFGLINPIMIQPIEWGVMSYASYVIGENFGVADHIYVIDDRLDASGMHIDGAFYLSGLVSVNHGVLEDMWISTPYVRSRAVTHALSVDPIIHQNNGEIARLYYDESVYSDFSGIVIGEGLQTFEFQEKSRFSESWFFQDAYIGLTNSSDELSLVYIEDLYPTLHGLKTVNKELIISTAVDMLVMQELMMRSGFFRKATYTLDHDLDMRMISSDAYKANQVSFDGIFKSNLSQSDHMLYSHQETDGGAYQYYSIFNLTLMNQTAQQAYATIGLFGILFGHVENINFRQSKIQVNLTDLDFESLKVGLIAGEMMNGSIHNVHVEVEISCLGDSVSIEELSMGSLVGEANGHIERSSSSGIIYGKKISHTSDLVIYQGGLIGKGNLLTLHTSKSNVEMSAIYGTDLSFSKLYLGGLISFGENITLSQVVFEGVIDLRNLEKGHEEAYIGGIFGLITGETTLNQIYQNGFLYIKPVVLNKMKVSGIGSLKNATFDLKRITHQGLIVTDVTDFTLTEYERNLQLFWMTSGLQIESSAGLIEGLFNDSSIQIDASYTDMYSHILIALSSQYTELFQGENNGHLSITTSHTLTHEKPQYSSLIIGENISGNHLRNEGNLNLNLTNEVSLSYPMASLSVSGILTNLSDNHTLKNVFQGGEISINQSGLFTLDTDLYVSGVLIDHENDSFSLEREIDPRSIEFEHIEGPMHNILQAGNITVTGSFRRNLYVSGLIFRQKGLLTQGINLGEIKVHNRDDITQGVASASGITSLLSGPYAWIMDSANQGNMRVSQISHQGFAHASGIASRNDLTWELTGVSPSDLHHLSKIAFTINYGDIYAWTESNETSYTISNETKSKAAGILAMGVLSLVNNVNYGSIYGKYLASGVIGFMPLNTFGTLNQNEVFVSNLIQYGNVRAISSYDFIDDVYSFDQNQVPSRTVYNAFGAMVGKIHTGTQTWAFAGDVTYPIDRIYFGYMVNMDSKINMFANAPELSSSWADGFGNLQEANDVILNMLAYMGTTNPNDQSKAPFTYFFQGGWIGQYMGKVIDHYTLSEEDGGIFHESFAFRSSRPIYSGTDQYIHDYIEYIDSDHANPELIQKLEQNTGQTLPGIYALSSSEGIGEGIFMPDNLDLISLHPYDSDKEELDTLWLGNIEDLDSISHKLYQKMRQIQASFAATIYDLEIVEMDQNGTPIPGGIKLTSPVIDQSRKLITYYLPSNASILLDTTSQLMDVYRYIEVSDGLGHKVPDIVTSGEQTYTWVGDYKKVDQNFVEIGPYHTTGTINLTTNDQNPVDSYSRNTPVYTQTLMDQGTLPSLFKHTPHTYIIFLWYASGYRVIPQTGITPGFAPYEAYSLSGYPTLYRYVGPSKETVTYIQTDVETDMTIFDDANLYFGVDTSKKDYLISKGSSLSFANESIMTLSSVPKSFGIYEAMYDADGNYIDSVEDHYGSVRVFSSSYNEADPASYQDYQIRIIRTADQSITDISSLSVQGVSALPNEYLFNNVTSNAHMQMIDRYQKGSVTVSYQTLNFADLQYIGDHVILKNAYTEEVIDPSLYSILQSVVKTDSSFNNQTGSWGSGIVTIELSVEENFPSGTYIISTELITGDTYDITFTKIMSSDANVLSITYQGQVIEPITDTITSFIPYGIFYDPDLYETNQVNFSNLYDIESISYLDLKNIFPSYLEGMEISLFSSIEAIDLHMDMIDDLRHRYVITYHLVAEDGSTRTFIHKLIEIMPDVLPKTIYQNGSIVSGTHHEINYNDSPTYRIVYDFNQIFVHEVSPLSIETSFVPLNIEDNAILGSDYLLGSLPDQGYEVDFVKQAPMGLYETTLHYNQQVELWGTVLTWEYVYSPILFTKVMNDQSMISDIFFVSDAVFQGFNTIIDATPLTIERYQYLLMNPSERPIVQLPTTGILYQEMKDLPSYYIIGQVQQTHLSYYLPTMILPDGAIIKRVVNELEISPEYQSDLLYADYSPLGDEFQFIHYRVYAMDYDINPTHYTDYYIAVQDMTNMIRFNVTIENQASVPLEEIYIRISVCRNEENNETCVYEDEILNMGIFSTYVNGSYEHPVFQTTTYGTYKVDVHLPESYGYQIQVYEVSIIGNAFYVENSIFPRKVYMTLIIVDQVVEKPWGMSEIAFIQP